MTEFMKDPLFITSVVIFVICVIIGFFGDKYIKKQKDIRQALKEDETKKAVSKENLETDKVVSEDDSNKILSDADSSKKALNDTYLIGKQEPSDEKNINLGQPVAFDGQVSNDDSVNNMF